MTKIYTDACIYNGNGGIGIYCETPSIGSSKLKKNYFGMTTQSLELDAIQIALSKVGLCQSATIFTDSTYAFESIVSNGDINNNSMWRTTKNKLMHCHELLKANYNTLKRYNRKGKDIKLEYSKGHSGIPGNMQADKLAGAAAGKPCSSHVAKALAIICNDVAPGTQQKSTILINAINNSSMPTKKKLASLPTVPQQSGFWSPFSQTIEVIDTASGPAQPILSVKDRISAIDISATEIPIREDISPFEEPSEVPDWGFSKKKLKKRKSIQDQSTQTELPQVEPIIQKVDSNLVDYNIHWTAPYKMPEYDEDIDLEVRDAIDDACSVEDYSEALPKIAPKEWKLFLSCIQCTEMVLIVYPKSHRISHEDELDIESETILAITKCRQCITTGHMNTGPVIKAVNVDTESKLYDDYFWKINLSTRMIQDSPAHVAACKIADTSVPILSTNGSVRFASILAITKLCGKGTRSLTVNVDKMELFGYLENGFL